MSLFRSLTTGRKGCLPCCTLSSLQKLVHGGSALWSQDHGERVTSGNFASTSQRDSATSIQSRPASPQPGCSRPLQQRREYSNLPESTVYSGPQAASAVKRVTLRTLRQKYQQDEMLSMVTAYDYPSAVHVDSAGIDMLLVGDSVGMVVHGHDTTLPVTMDDMLMHCRAVSRGARRPFLIADLPFGSYETSPTKAVESAIRFLKDGNMDAVKMEGGGPARAVAAGAMVQAGIAVMGHTGLMPQSVSVLGGFGPQARTAAGALQVVKDSVALEQAGCFALVLECVPPLVAAAVTRQLSIPTIGIGAGPYCSGQVLVYHDLLGMMQHPHHAKVTPKFCKQYATVGKQIELALRQYHEEVRSGKFPSAAFSPYKITDEEAATLADQLADEGYDAAAQGVVEHRGQVDEGVPYS